jgi:hypothetical protein
VKELRIEPTVRYDEAKNQWIAHFQSSAWVVENVRCASEDEAWATIRGEKPEPVPAGEAVARITDMMAKAARKAVEK